MMAVRRASNFDTSPVGLDVWYDSARAWALAIKARPIRIVFITVPLVRVWDNAFVILMLSYILSMIKTGILICLNNRHNADQHCLNLSQPCGDAL